MAKKGRPCLEEPRNKSIFIRVTENENLDIKRYAKEHNLTITQTLVKGFQTLQRQEEAREQC